MRYHYRQQNNIVKVLRNIILHKVCELREAGYFIRKANTNKKLKLHLIFSVSYARWQVL